MGNKSYKYVIITFGFDFKPYNFKNILRMKFLYHILFKQRLDFVYLLFLINFKILIVLIL